MVQDDCLWWILLYKLILLKGKVLFEVTVEIEPSNNIIAIQISPSTLPHEQSCQKYFFISKFKDSRWNRFDVRNMPYFEATSHCGKAALARMATSKRLSAEPVMPIQPIFPYNQNHHEVQNALYASFERGEDNHDKVIANTASTNHLSWTPPTGMHHRHPLPTL